MEVLTFIEEQIARAKADPSEQEAAVVECACAVKIFKRQIEPDKLRATQAMLASNAIYNGTWMAEWEKLGNQSAAVFSEKADEMLADVRLMRTLLDAQSVR
jgi:hypothetical protein